ncbi:DNA topoisomerase IV subunit A [Sutterella sp.]|uniref:DNA topoisomerase IV subunit A n=1 Tax=Sutterella sp. TaxID=1981025 RepID=UPI0026E06B86|nr:DNA topoisomerase IV subunit A [Sutterella sp.]MDO5531640.1 DNA topoisomerase IV subunit A [Sutterella sp.]
MAEKKRPGAGNGDSNFGSLFEAASAVFAAAEKFGKGVTPPAAKAPAKDGKPVTLKPVVPSEDAELEIPLIDEEEPVEEKEPATAEPEAPAESQADETAETDETDEPADEESAETEEAAEEDEAEAEEEKITVGSVTEGDPEENGALTLARYASQAYLEYAMSVVKSRALPEVTDGQKPVQRRILIDMYRMGLKFDGRSVKSARIVGDVLGKYHPHGDQSVYDALVRMAQTFSLRYPLLVAEGNFGSRDGDSAAAMRYTETRLTPIAELLLSEVDQGAVDFTANYDGNFQEPVELPAKLPFVLLNGSSGIAVGMATEIPPHNLGEVASACVKLLEKPESTLDEILALMPAPDFPCGGQIISSKDEIRSIYRTGRGKLRVRARWHFEELARGQWQLVVDELPPAASARTILDRIEQITNPRPKKDKKTVSAKQQQAKSAMLAMLESVRDESGKDIEVRLVFEPKTRTVDRNDFVNYLLSETDLESNVPVNLVMLGIDGKPRQKGLMEILSEWVSFRLETVRRRSQTRLDKVLDRIHVLEGRSLVLLNIDRVIEIIRAADDPKADLMREFSLTERQADDILEIRLKQLARLAAIEIEKELAKLVQERSSLERILSSEGVLKRQVAREIEAASKQYADPRRTLVEEAEVAVHEVQASDEPVTVVISKKGFLRSRTGHGHDCTLMSFKMGDGLATSIECRSTDSLSFLDSAGRVYTLAVSALPGGRGDGAPLSAFVDLPRGVNPVGWLAGDPVMPVMLATSGGKGMILRLGDISTRLKAGRDFVKLGEGETLLPPMPVAQAAIDAGAKLACLSSKGRLLVFPITEIRFVASGGKGVALMLLDAGESLVSCTVVDDRGCIIYGTGRGDKERAAEIGRRAFPAYVMHRARRGKTVEVSWRPERVEGYPGAAEPPEGIPPAGTPLKTASGLTLEVVDEPPTLL